MRAGIGIRSCFNDEDTSDFFLRLYGTWSRRASPSDSDGVAIVPDIEDSERNWRLAALALDERLPGGEGCRSKRGWTVGASIVDEFVDGVGVVLEVLREGFLDEADRESLVDRGLEIGGDRQGI